MRMHDRQMTGQVSTEVIEDKTCHLFGNITKSQVIPIFYWGIMQGQETAFMAVASYLERHAGGKGFLLAAYECEDWNDAFSPWPMAAAPGKEGFGGKARETLGWLEKYGMPSMESRYAEKLSGAEKVLRFPAGYSLAGLFSLWAYYESSLFAGAVSCSGSLWYAGWADYAARHAQADNGEMRYIYLSLGEKEERTKNRQMAVVGGNTRALYQSLTQKQGIESTLEWNPGGHFSEPELRVAKGIRWVLDRCAVRRG